MEAITSFGNYDYKKGGQLVSWDDKAVIEVPPGATVLLPTGTKRYSFMAVAPSERRYLFRQYCNAGALRWVEKGGRSDREWENILSEEELDAWKGKRVELGAASLKSFSKIGDIYVL
ncbi:hypothetical protein FB451DRAFT_1026761 [Mycena latifolia]|nr:hypothetical protein FB451DRAFT_1043768 [Mycena latifolia]KAJ7487168.1 hypothetical protein FB451DRAFT_1026761 [Mycena latifolia]